MIFMKCMKWIHLSLVQQLIHGGILIDAIFTTMILVPLILFRYWMLASSLAKILGAILSCTSSFCHLALSIFVALCDSCVEPQFSRQPHSCYAYSQKHHVVMVTLSLIPCVLEKLAVSTLRVTPLDLWSSCEICACSIIKGKDVPLGVHYQD